MKFKNALSSIFLKIIFTIALFVLILIAGLTYRHTQALAASGKLVSHTHQVQKELDGLLSVLKDIETGQRGYIITKDNFFLDPYHFGINTHKKKIEHLQKLVSDNAIQLLNIDTLTLLINVRIDLLNKSLKIALINNYDVDSLKQSMVNGKKVMDNIRNQITKMDNLEQTYLVERQDKFDNNSFITPIFTLAFVLFSLSVFIFSFYKINNDLAELKKSNEVLQINAASISQAEEIGDFSNWQWNLETKEYLFSDNLYRFLGCEPQSFEANLENFLAYVHPDDKHLLQEGTQRILNGGTTSKVVFRIVRKNGEIVYAKSASKLLEDVIGKKIIIGITSNVTKDYLYNKSLEQMNKDLADSNAELSSFNYVASHDLQEPLRKIETFISRIEDEDLKNLTPTTLSNFKKIENAVARMRQLITDLLTYSKSNKAEQKFEKTDLNTLIENVKLEFAPIIEDKKATLHVDHLPILNVIPFQMQQVFTNLIGNALKYCSIECECNIKITCNLLDKNLYNALPLSVTDDYYEIIINDNGIGFDEQYADQIFILFKRLVDSSSYPGTGIGLSICKKIIENHNGFIFAKSKLGEGATFIILLPQQ